MMTKKQKIRKFMRFCQDRLNIPEKVKTHVLWKECVLTTETGMGFGVTVEINDDIQAVWVAGKWGTKTIMGILAHEYAHVWQFRNGKAYSEEEAEEISQRLLKKYALAVDRKKKQRKARDS